MPGCFSFAGAAAEDASTRTLRRARWCCCILATAAAGADKELQDSDTVPWKREHRGVVLLLQTTTLAPAAGRGAAREGGCANAPAGARCCKSANMAAAEFSAGVGRTQIAIKVRIEAWCARICNARSGLAEAKRTPVFFGGFEECAQLTDLGCMPSTPST